MCLSLNVHTARSVFFCYNGASRVDGTGCVSLLVSAVGRTIPEEDPDKLAPQLRLLMAESPRVSVIQ